LLPPTVNRNPELPASTTAGLKYPSDGNGFVPLIWNSASPELPPPGEGFVTLTVAVPEAAMSAAAICACNWVSEENVVVRALPFHRTVAPDTKFSPVTINVNRAPPAVAELGLNNVIPGTGFEEGGGGGGEEAADPLVPPPHDWRKVKDENENAHQNQRRAGCRGSLNGMGAGDSSQSLN